MPSTDPIRILGIAGGLRADSYNRKLLRAAIEASPDGITVRPWEGLKALPPFDEDDEHAPGAAVEDLRDAIDHADALLIVTPEYNASLPGQLKNALDWASRPREASVLHDKCVAVIGASPSPGGARAAQDDARRILGRAGAEVVADELAITRAHQRFDANGRLTDLALWIELATFLAALADEVRAGALMAA